MRKNLCIKRLFLALPDQNLLAASTAPGVLHPLGPLCITPLHQQLFPHAQAVTSSVSPSGCVKAALSWELLPDFGLSLAAEVSGRNSATECLPAAGSRSQSSLILFLDRNGADWPQGVKGLGS